MPTCCIKQCSAKKNKNKPPLTFHRFPVDEKTWNKWINNVGLQNINMQHKVWYICSQHFEKSSFNKRFRLLQGAMPLGPHPIPERTIEAVFLPEVHTETESSCPIKSEPPDETFTENIPNAEVVLQEHTESESTCPNKLQEKFTKNLQIQAANIKIRLLERRFLSLKRKVKSLNERVRRRNKKK